MEQLTTPEPLLEEIERAVATHQPELAVSTTDALILLDGRFVVSGPSGPFDFYEVRVGVSPDYPAQEPIVFETAGRIPKDIDRHIFPKYDDCCLGVWEEWLLTSPNHRFETFLTGPMHDYFLSQSHFEATGEWPFGERSHGKQGVLESYADLLQLPCEEGLVASYLRILSRTHLKGHTPCPCGSGKKLRNCHRSEFEELKQRIPAFIAKRMYQRINGA